MTVKTRTIAVVWIGIMLWSLSAFSQNNLTIPIQGALTNDQGERLDGMFEMTFKLYATSDAVDPLFTETLNVDVNEGFFSIFLGEISTLDPAVFSENDNMYLEVGVEGQTMPHKMKLGMIPYAIFAHKAAEAQTLLGLTPDDLRLATDKVDWSDLENLPADLQDGDDDTVGDLTCSTDDFVGFDGSAWVCKKPTDTQLTEAEVDDMVSDNGYALSSNLATVATSGSFADLNNIPTGLSDGDNDTLGGLSCTIGQVAKKSADGWSCSDDTDTDTKLTEAEVDDMVSDNGYALSSNLATVATSGSFADLKNIPTGLSDGDNDTLGGLSCTTGQVAKKSSGGWICSEDTDTDTKLTEAEVDAMVDDNGYALSSKLATVATSGSFADLQDVPTGLSDGDNDTLGGLSCTVGQVAKKSADGWSCSEDTDTDTKLTEAEVDDMVSDNGYAADTHNHDGDYAASTHAHSTTDLTSGTLSTSRYSAYDDLTTESKIGTASTQVAAGNHNHDSAYAATSHNHDGSYATSTHAHSATDITSGTLSTSRYSAYSDLAAESKIGTASTQVAAGDHNHTSTYVDVSGDTMQGNLILAGNPTSDMMAATKQYVDNASSASSFVSAAGYTQNLTLTTSPSNVIQVGITAPATGYLMVQASGYFQGTVGTNWNGASVFITTDPAATTGTIRTRWYANANAVGTFETPYAIVGRISVTAGAHTVYLKAKKEGNGDIDIVFYNNLTVLFTPN